MHPDPSPDLDPDPAPEPAAQQQLTGQLRAALCAFVTEAGCRRSLPTRFHIGVPGGEHLTVPHDPWYDAGLRADVVTRALEGLLEDVPAGTARTGSGATPAVPCPWLTRQGDLGLVDADLQWFAAVREGYHRHGLVLPGFFVMTRRGWVDVATSEQRLWQRVRPARMATAATRPRQPGPPAR